MQMIETQRITPFQYMFSVSCYLQSSILMTSLLTTVSKQDSWLIFICAMVAAIPVLLIFLAIARSFPNKNLIEICLMTFGRIAGTIVSALFIWYFVTLAAYNLWGLGIFMRQTILVETPMIVTISMCILVSAYTVLKGFKVVTRYAPVFSLMSASLAVLVTLLTLNLMNLDYFRPMFDQPLIRYMQGANIMLSAPFGELVIFLMVLPNVARGNKGISRFLFGGFLIGGLTILTVIARDYAVLGRTSELFLLPPFETFRLVNIAESLNRVEVLFAIIMTVLLVFKITLILYISVLATAQLLRLKSYHPLVLIMSALIVAYSVFIYPSTTVQRALFRDQIPILWLLFSIMLPILILITGRLRGLHKTLMAKEAVEK